MPHAGGSVPMPFFRKAFERCVLSAICSTEEEFVRELALILTVDQLGFDDSEFPAGVAVID